MIDHPAHLRLAGIRAGAVSPAFFAQAADCGSIHLVAPAVSVHSHRRCTPLELASVPDGACDLGLQPRNIAADRCSRYKTVPVHVLALVLIYLAKNVLLVKKPVPRSVNKYKPKFVLVRSTKHLFLAVARYWQNLAVPRLQVWGTLFLVYTATFFSFVQLPIP